MGNKKKLKTKNSWIFGGVPGLVTGSREIGRESRGGAADVFQLYTDRRIEREGRGKVR